MTAGIEREFRPLPAACATLGFLLALAIPISHLPAQEPNSKVKLESLVRARVAGFKGRVSIYAKNLNSGLTYSLAGEEPVRTASTIKLPIMVECFAEAAEGKLALSEPLGVTADEKVSGSGILQDLSDNTQLPIRDMITLMITLSDNTATNLILNRIGGNAVNARMAQLGLQQTRVMRKIRGDGNKLKPFPSGVTEEGARAENKKWGIGRSSPREMVTLLERLYRGELVSKDASQQMIEILKKQRDHNGIGRHLKDTDIASKSGALDALRSDAGIVYTKQGSVAMAFTVDGMPEADWSPDNAGEVLISDLADMLLRELGNGP